VSAAGSRFAVTRTLASPTAIVLAIGGLYVGQSIIGGLTFIALPSVLRDRGLPLDQIGLIYLASLPWAVKFLWAPAVERYRLPAHGKARSRSIILATSLASALGLCVVAALGPAHLVPLIAAFVLIAFAASTGDIACDGHAVETLSESHHGWGNAAQVGGAYLGSALGSGLFLVLVGYLGWGKATLAMAALLLALALPFLLSPAPPSPGQRTHQPSLREALRRPDMRAGLLLAAVYVTAQKWGVAMLGPFLIDSGLDLASLGLVNGMGGLVVGFACALLGGALVRFWGARAVMVLALILQAARCTGWPWRPGKAACRNPCCSGWRWRVPRALWRSASSRSMPSSWRCRTRARPASTSPCCSAWTLSSAWQAASGRAGSRSISAMPPALRSLQSWRSSPPPSPLCSAAGRRGLAAFLPSWRRPSPSRR
jgi:MFS transporter (putative signal transducer)